MPPKDPTAKERKIRFRAEQERLGRRRTDLWLTPEERIALQEALVHIRAGAFAGTDENNEAARQMPTAEAAVPAPAAAPAPAAEASALPAGASTSSTSAPTDLVHSAYDPRVDLEQSRPGGVRRQLFPLLLVFDDPADENVRCLALENFGSVPVAVGLLNAYAAWTASTELLLYSRTKAVKMELRRWDVTKDLTTIASLAVAAGMPSEVDFCAEERTALCNPEAVLHAPFRARAFMMSKNDAGLADAARCALAIRVSEDFRTSTIVPEGVRGTEADPALHWGFEWFGTAHLDKKTLPASALLWSRVFYGALVRAGVRLASPMPSLFGARAAFASKTKILRPLSSTDRVVLDPLEGLVYRNGMLMI